MGHPPSDDSLVVEVALRTRLPNSGMANATVDATDEAANATHSLPLPVRVSSEDRRGSVLVDAAVVNNNNNPLRAAAGVVVAALVAANREAAAAGADQGMAAATAVTSSSSRMRQWRRRPCNRPNASNLSSCEGPVARTCDRGIGGVTRRIGNAHHGVRV
jgi:hypothetical protein